MSATLAEVARAGLAGLSIDAVARRSGVAAGTVYVYFPGKEALIGALYAKVKLEFGAGVLVDDGGPVRVGVEATCRNYFAYCRERPDELVFLDQIEGSPVWRDRVAATTATAMRPLVALLDRGKAERIVKDADTDGMIAFLAHGLRAVARLSRDDDPRHLDRRTADAVALCWSAVVA